MSTNLKKAITGGLLADIILGGQDAIVNVLGVTLAIATATRSNKVAIIAALATLFAGAVSMSAVAYTSTKAVRDHHKSKVKSERWEMKHKPEEERQEVRDIYHKKGFRGKLLDKIVKTITARKKLWLDVMLTDELGLPKKISKTPVGSASMVLLSSMIGLIPVAPFIFLPLNISIPIAIITGSILLFIAGAFKAKFTIGSWIKSGFEMLAVGLIASFIGYLIGYFLGMV